MKTARVQSACPGCQKEGTLQLTTVTINVPYFGDALESTLACDACGFRHGDFMILAQKEPVRLTFHAEGDEALRVRVIRSNSGTIRIPEIGFTAEPTPLSESFVSNVEGVLTRAHEVLNTAMRFHAEDEGKRALLERYLATHARLVAGEPFTLIIDDPFGNSAIVTEDVERRPLSEEEIAELKTGTIVIDADELRDPSDAS